MQSIVRILLAASILGVSISVASDEGPGPEPLPPLDGAYEIFGSFIIDYRPKMCVRAPCPPGNYVISLSDGPVGVFRVVILVHEVDGRLHKVHYEGQYLPETGEIVGRFFREGDTARIMVSPTIGAKP
jgi:hypothetical protein